MEVTNQKCINHAALGRQPGPDEHDSRNDGLTSAKRAKEREHAKYDAICLATGSILSPFALESTGGHGASSASVYSHFTNQLHDTALRRTLLLFKLSLSIARNTQHLQLGQAARQQQQTA